MLLQHWTASLRKNVAPPYRRLRSQHLWYLGIDALLSIFLVVGLFQFVNANGTSGAHEIELEHAGAISMSSTRIIERIHHEGRHAYWLGPQDLARYATDDMVPHVLTIIYLPTGADLFAPDQPKLTVRTFDDWASFERNGHAYFDSETTAHLLSTDGNNVIFDSKNMTSEIVLRPNSSEVVAISYTHQMTREEMLANADSLKVV